MWVDLGASPDYPPEPGVLVVRVEAPLMFANADLVRDQVLELVTDQAAAGTPVRAVILDGETVPGIDVTAAAMLQTQLHHELHDRGIRFGVARGIGEVRDVLSASRQGGEPVDLPDHRRRGRRSRRRPLRFTRNG